VDVELHERLVANRGEGVHLTGFDHEHIPGARFEGLTFDRPADATRLDELDLVVRMPMRAGPSTRLTAEEEDGAAHVGVIGADESV
jgi:hypothetical protein